MKTHCITFDGNYDFGVFRKISKFYFIRDHRTLLYTINTKPGSMLLLNFRYFSWKYSVTHLTIFHNIVRKCTSFYLIFPGADTQTLSIHGIFFKLPNKIASSKLRIPHSFVTLAFFRSGKI